MLKQYTALDAPSSFSHISSFRTDDRCKDVHYVAGDDHDEVYDTTRALFESFDKIVDYDVAYDNVTELWVGVTCEDI